MGVDKRERGCVYLLQRYGDDVREEEGEGGKRTKCSRGEEQAKMPKQILPEN